MEVVLRVVEQRLLVSSRSSAALWPQVVIWLVSDGLLLVLVATIITIGVVLVVDAG